MNAKQCFRREFGLRKGGFDQRYIESHCELLVQNTSKCFRSHESFDGIEFPNSKSDRTFSIDLTIFDFVNK
jgi:hypothetical protein